MKNTTAERKNNRVTAEPPEETELAIDRSPITPTDAVDEAEIRKIEELLQDTELAGGSIRLERKGPADSAYQYCTKIRVADGLDLDLIKRVWGGGDYKARTFRSNGQTYKQFTFSIDYRIKGSMDTSGTAAPQQDESKLAVTLASLLKPDNSQNSIFIKMMEQSSNANQQTMQMMMMMMQQSQQQSAAMMTAMATAMAGGQKGGGDIAMLVPVLTAMINKPTVEGKGLNLLEMVTAMRELKELSAPGSVPNKEEEEKETMMDKILKYGGPIVTALMTRTPIPMPGAAGAPSLPALQAPGETIEEQPMQQQLPPVFAAYVNMIIGAAQKNADTGTYADLIADNLDESQSTILVEILKREDWVEKLAETDKRVLNFVPWFTKLRNELLDLYGESEQSNPADAVQHAPPGADPAPKASGVAPVIIVPGAGAAS